MADDRGVLRWYTADPRGVLPLNQFHVPRSVRQLVTRNVFETRINHSFRDVMTGCRDRRAVDGTWISTELIDLYVRLQDMGFAHSVEAWRDGKLAGGLYGVAMGAAFFGESMFFYESGASKVALCALVDRLQQRGYELLDTQAVTSHLRKFGCTEIPAADYLDQLHHAIVKPRTFD